MVLFVLFFGCSKQVGARPREVNLLPLFSGTEDSSRITTFTNVTQPEMNRDAEAQKEMTTGGSSSNQEEIANSKKIMTRFLRKSVKSNNCIKKVFYREIYNHIFEIPVCKKHKGCREKFKTVNFSNGKNLAIRYDCYKWYQACLNSIYYYIYSVMLTKMRG